VAELRMRLRDKDFELLCKRADEMELLPAVYGRSLMLRLLRSEAPTHEPQGGHGL